MRKIIFFLLVFLNSSITHAAPSPLTLQECFQAALKRSEDIANQAELITQAEERFKQARGAVFPAINGSVLFGLQAAPSSATASSFSPPSQTTIRLSASQPLFRGLREFATMRQQKNLIQSAEWNRQQATLQLYQDLVLLFYQVLILQKDIQNLNNEIELNQKRVTELQRFIRVGRSRQSELLTLQTNIAVLEAQLASVQGQLASTRDAFAFMTGLDRETPLQDDQPIPQRANTEDVQKYIGRVDSRPDIHALQEAVLASEEGLLVARGAHFPSIDLTANYYFMRPGFLSDVNWDLQLGFTLPIFQGGIIQAQVRQAVSVKRQSELNLEKARRQAQQQIESFFHLFSSDWLQMEKQKSAVTLATQNYETEQKDYRLGLVTNLEVLQGLTTYQQNQRLLDRAQLQTKSDFIRLESAAGLRPKEVTELESREATEGPHSL